MLKDKLSKIITSKPDTIQFAKDRKYEQSWIIPRSKARPSEQEISDYLEREPFKLLIVEYLWNSQDDTSRFVMTIFLDQKCVLQDSGTFITTCLDLFYGYNDFAKLIDSIDTRVIGKPYLFTVPIEIANMSIFNHWLSVGPVELWQTGGIYDEKLIAEKIKARPDIKKSKLNYQGLFFRFNVSGKYDGPHFGIKTPCCKKEGDTWVVDYKMVDYWMKTMLTS